MKTYFTIFIVVLATSLLPSFQLWAQIPFTLDSNSELNVSGTSTIHDWTMTSKEGSGNAVLIIENGQLKEIQSLAVEMPVKSLKSGKSQMDKNAYAALKDDKYPNVMFELTGVREITKSHVKADGKLTIAGTTRPVSLHVGYKIEGNAIRFDSTQDITFTEYKISPPTAVFGTIKTGDNLHLSILVSFKQQNLKTHNP